MQNKPVKHVYHGIVKDFSMPPESTKVWLLDTVTKQSLDSNADSQKLLDAGIYENNTKFKIIIYDTPPHDIIKEDWSVQPNTPTVESEPEINNNNNNSAKSEILNIISNIESQLTKIKSHLNSL